MGLRVDTGKYRAPADGSFRLKDHDPADTGPFTSKKEGKEELERGVKMIREQQELLYASDRWALLLVFQAMDAAGKDSTIEHVMSGVNPMGCQVYSFKQPSDEELDHDFLWRTAVRTPERGRIGIFNRSYYEEVLIVRVHPEILAAQKLPAERVGEGVWQERFEDINAFERHLDRSGTVVRKFFLNVSREEQRKRFLQRLEDPDKNWKFSLGDLDQSQHWDRYMQAYEDMIRHTSTDHAPWYVVPADSKWFMRMAVADIIVETLEGLNLRFPEVSEKQRREIEEAQKRLGG
ncbi:MAG TPA: polyphosphate kinase 2 family protein [Vicinamibacteria bacterium]|jgi:PPK2 family polyphosphate:nucleotide phosphotransferase